MGKVVYDYFSKVFAEKGRVVYQSTTVSPRKVTREQNSQLTREVSFEELTKVINQMHPDKASGPDSLNPVFYQYF